MKLTSSIKLTFLFFFFISLASCGGNDPNADLNELIMGEWNVKSIETNGADIFPTTYTAQSYTFAINDDFAEQGDLEIVTALVGATTSTTEEYEYTISNEGKRIAWDFSAKDIVVADSTLTLFIGTGGDQMKVTAISAE